MESSARTSALGILLLGSQGAGEVLCTGTSGPRPVFSLRQVLELAMYIRLAMNSPSFSLPSAGEAHTTTPSQGLVWRIELYLG